MAGTLASASSARRRQRREFVADLQRCVPNARKENIEAALEDLEVRYIRSKQNPQKQTQADALVQLAAECGADLFHDGDIAYAAVTIPNDNDSGTHPETLQVNRKPFRHWLSRHFYEHFKKVAGEQALQDAVNALSGNAC